MANFTGKYTSKEERERRVGQAAEWLLQNPNGRYTDFLNHFKGEWDLCDKSLSLYYKDGGKKANELYDDKILLEKKRATVSLSNNYRDLDELWKETKDLNVYKQMLATKQEINKILGLYSNVDINEAAKAGNFDITQLIGFSNGGNDDAGDSGDDTEDRPEPKVRSII